MSAPSTSLDRSSSRSRALDWVSVGVAGLVVVSSLVLAGWVLLSGTENTSLAAAPALTLPPLSATARAEPSVLTSAFVGLPLAGHDRDVLVGIGARPGGPVDVVTIPSDESVVPANGVALRVGSAAASGSKAASCGERCLRFPLRVLAGEVTSFAVTVERSGKPSVRVVFHLPAKPPPAGDHLFRTARARMFALTSLGLHESLGSGLTKPLVSTWSFQAPDRFRYTIVGGSKAIVVGSRRWDWADGRWTPSTITPIQVPAYPWQDLRRAYVVGRARVGGNPVRELALLKPGTDFPTWFLVDVTDDGYVVRTTMTTTGHFMVDTYDAFDAASPIRPPS
jgi:hypothetical protein